jgi:pimeloyl-ACP methyl ester carboxylesterase
MRFVRLVGALLSVIVLGPFAASAQTAPKLATEEFMVPSKDPGIQLYVRNKHPEGIANFSPERTVLFVHGATYPAETSFDLPLGGASWMDQIARRGFDVYLVDLPGYGKSSRPPEMDQPPEANGPLVGLERSRFHPAAAQHRAH